MMIHHKLQAVVTIVFVSLFPALTGYSDTMRGTLLDDTLTVYSGEDFERIVSYTGSDTILIEENGSLTWNDSRIFASSSLLDHVAIDSGAGNDDITTHGSIALLTGSNVTTSRLTHTSSSSSTGIKTDLGNDTVDHNGTLTVSAQSTLTESTLSSTLLELYKNSIIAEILNNGEGNLINTTCASATGIDGDAGDDTIFQRGTLLVSSETLDTSQAVTRLVTSDSNGIVTGLGDDTVHNESSLSVSATATLSPSEVSSDSESIAIALATANASADAMGIDSGAGSDTISNTGNLEVTSLAQATQDTIAANSPLFSAAAGIIRSHAVSTGIDGGGDDDTITNTGDVNADATAITSIGGVSSESGFVAVTLANPRSDAETVGISGGLGDDTITSSTIRATSSAETAFDGYSSVLLGVASSCSTSTASASSAGISAGAGNDTIITTGVTESKSTANAAAVKASVSGLGASSPGPAWIGGTRADATAEGINGGLGDDKMTIDNSIITHSQATTTSVSGGAVIAGMASAMSTSKALSTSQCIKGDAGSDTVVNNAVLDADAISTAASIDASVSGVGVSSGSIFESGTTARSFAGGISTGIGEDTIDNNNVISIYGESNVDTAGISASLVGVAVSDTSTRAVSEVSGIDSGTCNDRITNDFFIGATAKADADAMNVTASLIGGAVAVDGIWNGGNSAEAMAVGINGNTGDDTISNLGPVMVDAQSSADTVKLAFSGLGFALTADSGLNGGTTSSAESMGIDGGTGDDTINNSALITSTSSATSVSTSGSATVIGISASVSNSEAESSATGIGGGMGDDTITNTGDILSDSYAKVNQTSITAALAGASITTDSLWRGGASAVSVSTGIDGGLGSDVILNEKSVTATAESEAFATDVAVTGIGLSLPEFTLWDTSTKASSIAVGIDGNAMDDDIQNTLTVKASATTTVDGRTIAVTLLGLGRSQTGIAGEAESIGIDGGAGNDTLLNSGTLNIDTLLTAYALNVTVDLAGVADGDVSTNGMSTAKGMDGSCGNDTLSNTGTIDIASTTTLDATGVTVNLIGTADADAKAVAAIKATGMDGGSGDDTIENNGTITLDAYGDAFAGSVSVDLAGTSESSAASKLDISAVGMDGSCGNDFLVNAETGTINFTRTEAFLDARGTAVNLFCTADTDVKTVAAIKVTGMDGGAGNDHVENKGDIIFNVDGTLHTGSVYVILAGPSESSAGSMLDISTTGMAGSDGNDTLINAESGAINPFPVSPLNPTEATLNLSNVVFNLAGTASAREALTALATTTGMDGGYGCDTLTNQGVINSFVKSTMKSDGNAIVIFGSSVDQGAADSTALAFGMNGGDGNDTMTNQGTLSAHAEAWATLYNDVFTFGGTTESEGSISAITRTTGLTGGSGNDTLENSGNVTASTVANFTLNGKPIAMFGTSESSGFAGTQTDATGMDGGKGDDSLVNTGSLNAASTAHVNLGSNGFTFGGVSENGGDLNASTNSTGMRGGDGQDHMDNSGTVIIRSTSDLSSTGGSNVVFGTSGTGARVGSKSTTTGMDGGAGDDVIKNSLSLDIGSSSEVDLSSSAFTLGGTAEAQSGIESYSLSSGLLGGSGNDCLSNSGTITINASSSLSNSDDVDVGIGSASSSSGVSTLSEAFGMAGGVGNDVLKNSGSLNVSSTSSVTLKSSSFTFGGIGGSSQTGSTVDAKAETFGILSGEGSDTVINSGALTVMASSDISSTGVSITKIGNNADVSTTISGMADATGLFLSGTESTVSNTSGMTVKALVDSSSSSDSNFGWYSDGRSDAVTQAFGNAYGILAEKGNVTLTNDDRILVESVILSDADADSDSKILLKFLNINADANATSNARAETDVNGICLGSGTHSITQNGSIGLAADITADAYSYANGDGADGDGTADVVSVTETHIAGITAGDGRTRLTNTNLIALNIKPYCKAKTFVDADLGGDSKSNAQAETLVDSEVISLGNGDHTVINSGALSIAVSENQTTLADGYCDGGDATSRSEAKAYMSATGIRTGNGTQAIENNDTITIDATIKAKAVSHADGDGIDGDGNSTAIAKAGARAWGILTGDGESRLTNNGQISVTTRPEARAGATVDSDGFGSSNISCSAEVSYSEAWGIKTGNGNQAITNNGSIHVQAHSVAINTIKDLHAVGIETGSGDDVITNNGAIWSLALKNGIQEQGMGINTGDGNDSIILGAGSSVVGALSLGSGDDMLTFDSDAALYGLVFGQQGIAYGGAGNDSLAFHGAGSTGATLSGFENVIKTGEGTYSVSTLPSMQHLSMENGALHIENDYSMMNSSSITVQLNDSDNYGQLISDGTISLAGSLVAEQSGGAFVTGDVLDIIVADDLEGEFASVTVPESTELLTFSFDQEDDRAQIEVGVESFTTVAESKNEMAIASYLDAILPHAEGSLNNAIGSVQRLSKGEFKEAFYTMGPASYLKGSVVTAANNAAYTQTVRNRMSAKRTEVCMNLQKDAPLLLAYNGNDTGIFHTQHSKKKSNAVWANGFGQWGDQDTTTDLAGFDYDMAGAAFGMDHTFNNGILLGMGLGYSMTRTDIKDSRIESDIDMISLSAYGSKLLEQAYVESVLSMGHGNDDTEKSNITGITTSSHDVEFVSAMLGWGFYERKGHWMLAPFSHVRYLFVTQDSFEESGPAALSVDSQNTDFLSMDLGASMTYAFETPGFTLIPELSLSWAHDFDINHSVITAGFSGMSQSFVIKEGSPEKDSAVVGLGMSCLVGSSLTTSLSGSAEFKEDYTAYGVLADIRYAF